MSSISSISKNTPIGLRRPIPKSSFKQVKTAKKKKSVKFQESEDVTKIHADDNLLDVKPGTVIISIRFEFSLSSFINFHSLQL